MRIITFDVGALPCALDLDVISVRRDSVPALGRAHLDDVFTRD